MRDFLQSLARQAKCLRETSYKSSGIGDNSKKLKVLQRFYDIDEITEAMPKRLHDYRKRPGLPAYNLGLPLPDDTAPGELVSRSRLIFDNQQPDRRVTHQVFGMSGELTEK